MTIPRTNEFVRDTCKMGQGAACCKYLSVALNKEGPWCCEKLTDMGRQLENLTNMISEADNCPGLSESDWKRKLNRPTLEVVQ